MRAVVKRPRPLRGVDLISVLFMIALDILIFHRKYGLPFPRWVDVQCGQDSSIEAEASITDERLTDGQRSRCCTALSNFVSTFEV